MTYYKADVFSYKCDVHNFWTFDAAAARDHVKDFHEAKKDD